MIKAEIILCFVYFAILYIIAFFSNLKYREPDNILWISKSQWRAILVMWLPSLIIFTK